MKTIYQSKIGLEIVIPLILIFCLAIFLSQDGYSIWIVFALAPPILFIVYLFSNTYYTIQENFLFIKSGFLVNKKIAIENITQIKETTNWQSAPALSLDRLEIKYDGAQTILVSPDAKQQFINHILEINSDIHIVMKN